MIAFRILFAATLLCLCVVLAKSKARKLELRTRALGDFMSIVRQMEVLIRVSGLTIPDALVECSRRLSDRWTAAFAKTLAGLYGDKSSSSGMWPEALRVTARNFEEAASLTKEDCQIIGLFGDQLASSDLKSIGENYAFLYSRIGENLKDSDRDRTVKGRLYNTIGILAGLAAAIVVL